MPVSSTVIKLPAQTGVALELRPGQTLRIIDLNGKQVADLALFSAVDLAESFSPGRTIDYNETIGIRRGLELYSNRSTRFARVVEDTVGIHDQLLAPCSEAMYERRGQHGHRSCHANLAEALRRFGITPDLVSATINVFMDVRIRPNGDVAIFPPASRSGDVFALQALCPLVVGLTACSSELTNDGRCKPIGYEVLP